MCLGIIYSQFINVSIINIECFPIFKMSKVSQITMKKTKQKNPSDSSSPKRQIYKCSITLFQIWLWYWFCLYKRQKKAVFVQTVFTASSHNTAAALLDNFQVFRGNKKQQKEKIRTQTFLISQARIVSILLPVCKMIQTSLQVPETPGRLLQSLRVNLISM